MLAGGHAVPIIDIKRRYYRSMENLPTAMQLADVTYIFDNTKTEYLALLTIVKDNFIQKISQQNFPTWLTSRVDAVSLVLGRQLVFQTA